MQHERSASTRPRRIKVNGRRGIYYREGQDGRRRYEIGYRDSAGKQRWKAVTGNLKDAEAALEEVRGRLRRGERVAPTRQTFEDVAKAWLAAQSEIRPRTREAYDCALRVHLLPRFGRRRITTITDEDVIHLIADLGEAGYTGWTIRGRLTPLAGTLKYAARRGLIGHDPMQRLERGERPKVGRHEMRILSRSEIGALVDAADDAHRPLLATALFTGLRIGELLGLIWANIDFDRGSVQVRRQLDRREGTRVQTKTAQAVRDVILMPPLARILREHRLRSPFAAGGDYVFASSVGRGLDQSVPRRALKRALRAAKLDGQDRVVLRFHDLRHTFRASSSPRARTSSGCRANSGTSRRTRR